MFRRTARRTARRTSRRMGRRQEAAPTQDSTATPTQSEPDQTAKLKELADLHASGELTDEEYSAAKAKLLGL